MIEKHSTKRRNAIISVLLIAALVITGIFAFMTATDRKDNVFTIGKVKAELWEDFDTDGDGTAETINATTKTAEFEGTLMPGDKVIKAPYVKNTGTSPEYIFATVAVPYAAKADVYDYGDGAAISGTEKDIIIRSYAFQVSEGKTADETWTEYALDVDGNGETLDATEAGNVIQLFDISSGSDGNTDGFNTTNWTVLNNGSPVVSDDGYEYYVLKYNTTLAAGSSTEEMFNFVTLSERIGEEPPAIVTANFYSSPDELVTSASDVNTSELELVYTTQIARGSTLETIPDVPKSLEDSFTGAWVAQETGKVANKVIPLEDDVNYIAEYSNLNTILNDSTEILEPADFLQYALMYDENNELYACVVGADYDAENYPWRGGSSSSSNPINGSYSGDYRTLVVPSEIYVTFEGYSGDIVGSVRHPIFTCANGTMVNAGSIRQIQRTENSVSTVGLDLPFDGEIGDNFTIPVRAIGMPEHKMSDIHEYLANYSSTKGYTNLFIVETLILPDSIDYFYNWTTYYASKLKAINFPVCEIGVNGLSLADGLGLCSYIEKIHFSEGVTDLSGLQISQNSLKEINSPASITHGAYSPSGTNGPLKVVVDDWDVWTKSVPVVYNLENGVEVWVDGEKAQSEFDEFTITTDMVNPLALVGCDIGTLILDEGITSVDLHRANSIDTLVLPKSLTSTENLTVVSLQRGRVDLASCDLPNSVTCIKYNGTMNDWLSITRRGPSDSLFKRGYSNDFYIDNELVKDVVIDCNVGDYAFYGYGGITSITTTSNCHTIGARAFDYREQSGLSLTSINLAEGLESIGERAFYQQRNLATATLPSTLQTIADEAFNACYGLTTVNYRGTQTQWNSISVGSNNANLLSAAITYGYVG